MHYDSMFLQGLFFYITLLYLNCTIQNNWHSHTVNKWQVQYLITTKACIKVTSNCFREGKAVCVLVFRLYLLKTSIGKNGSLLVCKRWTTASSARPSEVSLGHAHGQHPLTGGEEANIHVRMGQSPLGCSTHSDSTYADWLWDVVQEGSAWELFISRLHRQTQSLKLKTIPFFTGESWCIHVLWLCFAFYYLNM